MRHFVFALLIALLPLRGWVGDAMALNMVRPLLASNALAAAQAADHTNPVADHTNPVADHTGCAGGTNDAGQHSTCSACDVCNGPALVWAQTLPSSGMLPQGRMPLTNASFASSEPQPGIKPPIS